MSMKRTLQKVLKKRLTLHILISLLIVVLMIITFLYINSLNRIKQYENYVDSINEYYSDREKKLNEKESELTNRIQEMNEKYFVKRIYEILEEDDILFLAKKQWRYELFINEKPVDLSNGNVITVNDTDIFISLKETSDRDLLPENILNYGSISLGNESNRLQDNLMIRSSYLKEIKEQKIKDGVIITYEFSSIPVGQEITLQLSELLRERLNYTTKIIKIIKQ